MSATAERITLPNIHEMFPEELLTRLAPAGPLQYLCAQAPSAALPSPPTSQGGRSFDLYITSGSLIRLNHLRQCDLLPTQQNGPTSAMTYPSCRAGEGKYPCLECGKAFDRSSNLAVQVATHTCVRPFRCPFLGCGRWFNNNSNMLRHVRNHSSTRLSLTNSTRMLPACHTSSCAPETPRVYEGLCRREDARDDSTSEKRLDPFRYSNLQPGHQRLGSPTKITRTRHAVEGKYTCSECGKGFGWPSGLARHVITHTDATPFRCPLLGCGRRFNVNSNMRRHFRTHRSSQLPSNTASPSTYPVDYYPACPLLPPRNLLRAGPAACV